MMESLRWVIAKLVIFTIVTLVVTVWLASAIGNFKLFAQPYEITASFTDASGLLRGDVVKAAGVTIGRVDGISVDRGVAKVTMSIDENNALPDNLGAEIRYRNLIGQRMVTLVPMPGVDATGDLEGGDEIGLERTKPAFDLSVLFNGLRPLIRSTNPNDINLVAHELTKSLEGRGQDVESFLSNVTAISEMLASKDAELDQLLDGLNVVTEDVAGRDAQLRHTLASFSDFLGDLEASRGDLDQALLALDDAAQRIDRLVTRNDENITASIDDLSIILDAVNDRREDLRGAVQNLPVMLEAIERVTSYGQWQNVHLIHACRDDTGNCGSRATP
jgi:phospholipid/cholesterol/gamma-HCH transport system substrate-binding protein